MVKIITSEDCGNSPKNILLEKITIAFATNDSAFILSSVTDDICWTIVGDTLMNGKEKFSAELERRSRVKARETSIYHVATHGKSGAVNGMTKLENGHRLEFCHIYEFNGAKGTSVKAITSYVIEIR